MTTARGGVAPADHDGVGAPPATLAARFRPAPGSEV
jgi:hypothetical protein